MKQCTLCSPVVQGFIVDHVSKEEHELIVKHFHQFHAVEWEQLPTGDLWLTAKTFQKYETYWSEFLQPQSWRIRSAKRLIDGGLEIGETVSWAEVKAGLPQLWIDDIISGGHLLMMYQPIVKVEETVELVAYELLARGVDPDESLIPPFKLFEQARNEERLFALDRACRVTAVEAAVRTPEDTKVFINFIPTSIYNPAHCLQTTMAATSKFGIDPSRLVFEVVETDLVDDPDHLRTIFDYYRSKGIRCALDDVGAGFNNVEMVKSLKPDFIKLDRSISDGIAFSREKQEIAQRIFDAASSSGTIALGEGIESLSDALKLAALGYTWQQGYLYGRPSLEPQSPNIHELAFDLAA